METVDPFISGSKPTIEVPTPFFVYVNELTTGKSSDLVPSFQENAFFVLHSIRSILELFVIPLTLNTRCVLPALIL